jgi:hypothetical protein
MAAGKPAAKATGRHHNVREDMGFSSADVTAKQRFRQTFKPTPV